MAAFARHKARPAIRKTQLSGALKTYYNMKLHQRLVERSERIIQKRMASRAAFLKRRLLGGEE